MYACTSFGGINVMYVDEEKEDLECFPMTQLPYT